MTDHCPACRISRELREHRDQVAPTWDQRRVTLNFARIVAERACPEYVAAGANPASYKGSEVRWGQQKTAPGGALTPDSQGLAVYEGDD